MRPVQHNRFCVRYLPLYPQDGGFPASPTLHGATVWTLHWIQSDSQTVRQSDRQTVGQSDSQTVRQSDRQTVRQSDSQTVMGIGSSGGWDDSQWTGDHDSCKQICEGDSCKQTGAGECHSWYYKQVSLEQGGGLQAGQGRQLQDRQEGDCKQRRRTPSVGKKGRTSLELTELSTSSFRARKTV